MTSMRKIISSVTALVILLQVLALSGCETEVIQDPYKDVRTTARTEIWKDINAGNAISASVAVMDNGKIVYSEGFGMADRENSVNVDSNTIYNIGSVSKIFCSTAIMILVDEKKVELDKPVTNYINDFVMADPRYKDITVRMLLNHSSGLAGTSVSNLVTYEPNKDYTKTMLSSLSRSYLKHKPGEMSVYCNDGFTLAEIVVQRTTGKSLVDFLSEKVFTPLSMTHTGPGVGERNYTMTTQKGNAGQTVFAAEYKIETGEKLLLETLNVIGSGGLSSTPEDLCKFAYSLSGGGKQVVSEASKLELQKAQPGTFTDLLYGLGSDFTDLPIYQSQGIKVMGKTGGTLNYTSMLLYVPDKKIVVAGIAAGPHSGLVKIASDILNDVLASKGIMKKRENVVAKPAQAENLPQEYKDFGGYYASENNLFRVTIDDDKNAINLISIENEQEIAFDQLYYKQGFLVGTKNHSKYLFKNLDGTRCLMQHSDEWGIDMFFAERISTPREPKTLKIDMNNKLWARRNFIPTEVMETDELLTRESHTIGSLPGYVDFGGLREVKSSTFAGMPVKTIRDQEEISLFDNGKETWVWLSNLLYSPIDSVRLMQAGEDTVRIGANNYNEWVKTDNDLILSFEKPAKGRVIVISPECDPIYDSALSKGEIYAAKGSYVVFAGASDDVFKIKSR